MKKKSPNGRPRKADAEQAKTQPKPHEDIYDQLGSERAREVRAENAFLDSPVTVRTLLEVASAAVAEIKDLDGEAETNYYAALESFALKTRSWVEWEKRQKKST